MELMLEPMLSRDVKYQEIKHLEEVYKKNGIMRFTDIDINFDINYDDHEKPSKCP